MICFDRSAGLQHKLAEFGFIEDEQGIFDANGKNR